VNGYRSFAVWPVLVGGIRNLSPRLSRTPTHAHSRARPKAANRNVTRVVKYGQVIAGAWGIRSQEQEIGLYYSEKQRDGCPAVANVLAAK
jgi:hypothetical protein